MHFGLRVSHAGGRTPAHCLRFAHPAQATRRLEARVRVGKAEAGRAGVQKTKRLKKTAEQANLKDAGSILDACGIAPTRQDFGVFVEALGSPRRSIWVLFH